MNSTFKTLKNIITLNCSLGRSLAATGFGRVFAQKQRFTALFFVALLFFQFIAAFATPIMQQAKADSKLPDPLAQAKQEPITPTAVGDAAGGSKLAQTKPADVGKNIQAKHDKNHTVLSETATSVTTNTTQYSDGSQRVRTAATSINEKTDQGYTAINRRLGEDALNAQNVAGQTLDLTKVVKESGKFTPKSFSGKNKNSGFKFPTLDAGKAISFTVDGKTIDLYPQNANPTIIPIKKSGKSNDAVVYENVWKDVDVQYDYLGDTIKESIIIKSADAASSYSFKVSGGNIVKRADGSLGIEGSTISIGQVSLSLYNQGVVTAPLDLSFDKSTINIKLDSAYLKKLKAADFPAVIDPDYGAGRGGVTGGGNDYVSFDDYGNVVNSQQDWMDIGSTRWSNGQVHTWHVEPHVDYSFIGNRQVDEAYLYTSMRDDARAGAGTYNTQDIWITWAPAFNFNYGGGAPVAHGVISDGGWTNVTALFQWLHANAGTGGYLVMWTNEGGTTFKRLDPYDTYVDIYVSDYNSRPTAPALLAPVDGQVFTDTQPSFRLGAASDANGDNLTYWYRIMGGRPGSCDAPVSTIIDSFDQSALQWTVPEGVLKDGETYWFCAYSHDNAENTTHYAGGNYWNWTTPISFKVDFRLGKDKTQTYDDTGPFSVNYSNGNVSMSASSHTMNALGGSMGVNLEYNSPYASRPGLNANYYSNTTQSGAPVVSRVDGNIDFNWGVGSPSNILPSVDNWSSKWTGYFVAPEAGTYTFGAINDDGMSIALAGTTMYNAGCYSLTTVCWGSTTMALEQGQAVPIEVNFSEASGLAYATMYASFNGKQQVVPKDWLRTAVQQVKANNGLTGRYFKLEDGEPLAMPTDGRQPFLTRDDTQVNFNWGSGSPIPGAPADRFTARWTGFITVPQDTTNGYTYCVTSDDGMRLSFDNTVYRENWADNPGQFCGAALNWKAGETHAVTLDYYENGGGAQVAFQVAYAGRPIENVSATWLTPSVKSLPDGWNLGIDPDGNVSYETMQIAGSGNVTLYDSTGDKHLYTYVNGGYTPPTNEHGVLAKNVDNTYTLQDDDGRTYQFNQAGVLSSVTTPQDDRQPAALQYQYGGVPSRIQKIVDGVDTSRTMSIYYSGDTNCPAVASGFTAAPANMICAAVSTDGNYTYFRYQNGLLSRIETNGGVITDLAYDSLGRIVQVREPLANDAVGAGVRANDVTVTTQVNYDTLGRASDVTLPSATATSVRSVHNYKYTRLADTTSLGTTSMLDTKEAMPLGYAQKIEYDNLLREVNTYDKQGLKSTTLWDQFKDLSLASIDPTGLESTTVYNGLDLPTDTYGPAPSSWFTAPSSPLSQNTPIVPTSSYTAQVPHTQTQYNQGISGLALTYYGRKSLTGAAGMHATGFNNVPAVSIGYAAGAYPVTATDGFSMRATGKILLPEAGAHTFRIWSDGGAKLYIDGGLVVNDWTDGGDRSHPTGVYTNAVANTYHDITVEYYHSGTTTNSIIQLFKTAPGGSENGNFSNLLDPGYNLATSTTVFDTIQGNTTTTTSFGNRPELAQPVSTTEDAGGLNLTTTTTYEPQASGSYLRQTSSTLPAGVKTQYLYYGGTETRDNPCTSAVESFRQAGLPKGKIEADPDGTGSQTSRTSETVYDDSGRVVATRLNTDAWTCTNYDARGRIISTVIPALNGQAARTVTNNYAVGGNPLITSTGDTSGTVTTETDLLSHVIKYTDVKGNVTTISIDGSGRLASRTSPLGTETFTYDSYDRMTDQALDGTILAHVNYDQYSNITSVNYPAGAQKLSSLGKDSIGRINNLTYTLANGSTVGDTVTRTVSGDIINGTENGVSKSYSYDNANRLLSATLGTNTFAYDYSAPTSAQCSQSSANLNANKDGNRTKSIINNGTAATYCYDQADRLIGSSDTTIGTPIYDAHGNITQVGTPGVLTTNFYYDSSDRNSDIAQTATTNTTSSSKNALGQTTTINSNIVETKKSSYARDAQGRIASRTTAGNTITTTKTTPPVGSPTTKSTTTLAPTVVSNYGFTGSGDTPDFITDSTSAVVEKYIQLPGNVLLTLRPKETDANKKAVYSLPNIHGDVFATTSATGALLSTYLSGPFGEKIAGQVNPANTLASASYAYVGQHEKLTETNFALAPIQMGARVYLPSIGRFTSVDPVQGGTDNNYSYVVDPVNDFDLEGTFGFRFLAKMAMKAVHIGSFIPGPIGMIATGVIVGIDVATGNYAGAAVDAIGLIPGGKIASKLGKEGEAAVHAATGLKKNTQVFKVAGKARIPDFVGPKAIHEAKNVAKLSHTKQIKDYQALAGTKKQLVLWTRKTTRMSAPLQHQINTGRIVHRTFRW
jgi:RHS repeat-associated protein